MAIPASQILGRVSATLNDAGNVQWPQAELLQHLSQAQRACVLLRPEVNPVTFAHQMVAGTRQQLPADGFLLMDVIRNLGADGATPGRAITPADRSALDQTMPDWHMATANGSVVNFVHDVRNRSIFYVSPPQPADPHWAEIVYARIPGEIQAVDDDIQIDDVYEPALFHYVLYRALVKDLPAMGQGEEKAQFHFDRFIMLLTGKAEEQEADVTMRHETTERTEP